MAENDIYNSEGKYKRYLATLDNLLINPEDRPKPITNTGKERKVEYHYYCKNPANLAYFRALARVFDVKDISYVRRLRLFNNLKLIVHATKKDLKDCERADIDSIVIFMHSRCKSPKTKADFIRDIKYFWRILFPEIDNKGRVDETICPYVVRHLSGKQDKSKEKARQDKISVDEFLKIVDYFSKEPRMQAFLTLALESLGRVQELLYLRVKDIELYDGFAKVWVSSHGKEGIKMLQCSDSFPYVLEWYNKHPYKTNTESYFFINQGNKDRIAQMKPAQINKRLRVAMKDLGIKKPFTAYSLKRNGVSFDVMAGKSPQSIQQKAGWSSTKQLSTYDNTNQQDAYTIELIKQGKISEPTILAKYAGFVNGKDFKSNKVCLCGHVCGFADSFCPKCNRPLGQKETIQKQAEENNRLTKELETMKEQQKQDRERLEFVFNCLKKGELSVLKQGIN